jgi:hypothetical protein
MSKKKSKLSGDDLENSISELFAKSQKTQAVHQDTAKNLQKLLGQDFEQFRFVCAPAFSLANSLEKFSLTKSSKYYLCL